MSQKNIILSHFDKKDIVVIAPLYWGLGHAARCIPLISMLKEHCEKVIIASDGDALNFLSSHFPEVQTIELPGYGIQYRYNSIMWNVAVAGKKIVDAIREERKIMQQLVKQSRATVILSDNRLGCRADAAKNIFLTHQLTIQHNNSLAKWIANLLHGYFIKKFDVCMVPDLQGKNSLCPALSHSSLYNPVYIGPLTRIKYQPLSKAWDICVLLSGPEPQRSILEDLLFQQLLLLTMYKIVFVRGVQNPNHSLKTTKHITSKNWINAQEVETILNSSSLLISRSGYSTVMDVHHLPIKAIFIPTPGQSEQEYLADTLQLQQKYSCLYQNDLKKLANTIHLLI